MNFSWETLLQILSIVFGAGGVFAFWRTKAQNQLDISSAWEKFSAPLLQRIEGLEQETAEQKKIIRDLNNFIDDLLDWNNTLARQVLESGKIPHPFVRRKRYPPTEYPSTQE